MTDAERIEQIEMQLRTWRQLLRQTDENAAAISEGWSAEDVTARRDLCRESIGALEAQLAQIEGREYAAPAKVSDGDHVRVGDAEDVIAELTEMASDQDVDITDVMDVIAELSDCISDLYELVGGE